MQGKMYSYKIAMLPHPADQEEFLNHLGVEGWRLVTVKDEPGYGTRAYLIREH